MDFSEPTLNVWMVCNVPPPSQCKTRPFSVMAPLSSFIRPPTNCALDHVFTLPHADVCGVSLGSVLQPTTSNTSVIISDLENVCNSDCGGNYAEHLKTNCKDTISAEILKMICTPSGIDATVGPYCRFAYGTLYDQSFLGPLFHSCGTGLCSSQCRAGLARMKSQIGCCYQTIYNNTYFLTTTFNAGLIAPAAFFGLQSLGNSTANPWIACGIEAPQMCDGEPFPVTLPPAVCSLDNWISFILQLPNGIECGPNVATVFSPPANVSMVSHALNIVCNATCGGVLYQYLRTTCNDQPSSELLQLYCTPTFGGSTVGPRCRFASADLLSSSTISDLQSCNATSGRACSSECREALIQLSSQLGCCYQSMYNNSVLLSVLKDAGFITTNSLQLFEYLRSPANNIWTLCNVTVPRKCMGDAFPTTPGKPPKLVINYCTNLKPYLQIALQEHIKKALLVNLAL